MVGSCRPSHSLLRRVAIAAFSVALASLPLSAVAQDQAQRGYSSSADSKLYLDTDIDGSSLAADPNPTPRPQYGQTGNRYPSYDNKWSHIAFEAGGGFTAPVGNDVSGGEGAGLSGYNTWGYNIGVGAGWNFNKWLGALIEYQFNRNKIPGSTLSAVGAPGGNVNTWSFTVDPIVYLPVTHKAGAYVTGGGGFYRKVTNFTSPQQACYYDPFYGLICGTQNATIYHFSSNQGGLNIGAGLYWKAFGPDSHAKLYAEARYVWVNSPSATINQPLAGGSEGLIPVTVGIRF